MHKLCKTWPSKLRGNKLVSFEITGVASGLMVVASGKDGVAERVCGGDVDTTFVG